MNTKPTSIVIVKLHTLTCMHMHYLQNRPACLRACSAIWCKEAVIDMFEYLCLLRSGVIIKTMLNQYFCAYVRVCINVYGHSSGDEFLYDAAVLSKYCEYCHIMYVAKSSSDKLLSTDCLCCYLNSRYSCLPGHTRLLLLLFCGP